MLHDAKENVGKFRIEERPGIYRMNTQKNYTLFKKKEQLDLISEWTEKEPFVFSCAVFYQKNIENGESEFDFGMGLRCFPNKKILRNSPCLPACKQKNIATRLRDTT